MKKGAYDLGRKAIYYIVVIIIIAILFVYISNSFRKFQIVRFSALNEVTDFVILNNVIKCVSQKDADTGRIYLYQIDETKLNKDSLTACLGTNKIYSSKSIMLKINGEEKLTTQKPIFDYSKYEKPVQYSRSDATLEIYIEKYPKIT
jgi:hypothetical protein